VLSARAGDLDIAYREAGSGDPVFLVNGTGESGATWKPQIDALARSRRCIAIDNRDTGESSYTDHAYTPKDLAGDAAAVIDALALGPCHVVGYSLGGAVAQELALARPELVRSLVLLSTWARSDDWFVAEMRSWQAIRRAHWDDEQAFLDALAVWLFSPRTFEHAGMVDRLYAIAEGEYTPQRPDGWIRQTEADIVHDAAARLGDVRAPALVIVGEDDICTPLRYSQELVSLVSDAELVTIPGAGHAALQERPDQVNRAIQGFLSRVESR
jgi:pimeloyl-ACP methyl ester carboxylesterase